MTINTNETQRIRMASRRRCRSLAAAARTRCQSLAPDVRNVRRFHVNVDDRLMSPPMTAFTFAFGVVLCCIGLLRSIHIDTKIVKLFGICLTNHARAVTCPPIESAKCENGTVAGTFLVYVFSQRVIRGLTNESS